MGKSFYSTKSKEKYFLLVDALRFISYDEKIKSKDLFIPNNCEKFGFVEGYHNLSELLYFLADMLEE